MKIMNIKKIDNSIEALERAINNKKLSCDDPLLLDIKNILLGMKADISTRKILKRIKKNINKEKNKCINY
jgi:hypothetical protein